MVDLCPFGVTPITIPFLYLEDFPRSRAFLLLQKQEYQIFSQTPLLLGHQHVPQM